MALTHTPASKIIHKWKDGIVFSAKKVLRFAIIFYGLIKSKELIIMMRYKNVSLEIPSKPTPKPSIPKQKCQDHGECAWNLCHDNGKRVCVVPWS